MRFVPWLILTTVCVYGSQLPSSYEPYDISSRKEVVDLPGLEGSFRSKHYAGYLTVDAFFRRNLYYYFVQSERNSTKDPVVLWLNGGPGCSSFDGFVYEHGPFNFDFNNGNVTLKNNDFAWSKVANVIYLDSPVGVGMSYAEGTVYYASDDESTAKDLLQAVLKFYEIFPEFKSNRFFVAGESYAGIYVPLLVEQIVTHNEDNPFKKIPIIGYLIGNGVTDKQIDDNAFPPFAYGKSLISKQTFDEITEACDGKYWNQSYDSLCYELQAQAYADLLPRLNMYDVARECQNPPEGYKKAQNGDLRSRANRFWRKHGRQWPMGPVPRNGRVHNWRTATNEEAPCLDYWTAETWLNQPEVREAIHAAPQNETGPFLVCSNRVFYTSTVSSVFYLHYTLIDTYGMYALIFTGDHDMAVPHTGTEEWTTLLGLPIINRWTEWLDDNLQVGGYHVEYDHLTFCTVRNAGHMVPNTHPAHGLVMFERYITNLTMEKF